MIIREALAGVDRYRGFRDALGMSDHTLTRRLTHLQEVGLLRRGEGLHPRYQLTQAGEEFATVLAVLGDWSLRWLPVDRPIRQPSEAVLLAAEQLGLDISSL